MSCIKSSILTIRSAPIMNLPRLSPIENSPITTSELASVSPVNPSSDMRENASIVASLLTRSRDPSSLLRHLSVYRCCLATNEARRCATRLGSARRKHRFVYCCVIVGACFVVTVVARRKYTTILSKIYA
jgi:hypothetical protein